MQWDWRQRNLRLSVGELSRFSLMPAVDEGTGRWRMELGAHWHEVLHQRTRENESGWLFEQPVAGVLQQGGWSFDLRGRVDQFQPGPEAVLREIKTTTLSLPAEEAELRTRYPHYFHQAMVYAFLLGRESTFPRTELLFLEIQTGLTQTVVLGEADLEALHRHLLMIVAALEERQEHFGRLRHLSVPFPFPEWRPGQEEARRDLVDHLQQHRICLFEAPTGFGKTGLALEQALKEIASGEADRILLLTGKNTGHAPLIKQLEAFRQSGHELAIHTLRSRRDLAVDVGMEQRISPQEVLDNWRASGLSAPGLLKEGIPSLESIKELGLRHGIPPWALSRLLLPYADVWIADFNYLFDPGVSQVLESIPTYDPGRTLLVVDEAHNLPERAAASRSHLLDATEIERVLTEVQMAHFSSTLARAMDHLLVSVRRQAPCDTLGPAQEADLISILRDVRQALQESGFAEDTLSIEALEWLWEVGSLLEDWDHPHLSMLISSPAKGKVLVSCLDASAVTGPILQGFQKVILMSATLQPWDDYIRSIGLAAEPGRSEVACVKGQAPWLEGCFEVWADGRVDTRFRERDRHLQTTATTIGETALSGQGCTAVFFPSYQYAELVMERIRFQYPSLRCSLQPRDLPLEQQNAYLQESLLVQDVLFLVLGSRFSEGIDALGGQIRQAIVVSPALPEVNSRQRARQQALPVPASAAFRSVYMIPGMRKISQALGRLVREPGHSARVLLHGKRFMEPDYQHLLPSYLFPGGHILSDEDLSRHWLRDRGFAEL